MGLYKPVEGCCEWLAEPVPPDPALAVGAAVNSLAGHRDAVRRLITFLAAFLRCWSIPSPAAIGDKQLVPPRSRWARRGAADDEVILPRRAGVSPAFV